MRGSRAVRRAGRVTAVLAGFVLTVVVSLAVPASAGGSLTTEAGDGSIWNFALTDSSSQVNSDSDGSIWN